MEPQQDGLPEEAVDLLTEIYKATYRTGKILEEWLRMKVVFIPKAGKATYASPKSYRPITWKD